MSEHMPLIRYKYGIRVHEEVVEAALRSCSCSANSHHIFTPQQATGEHMDMRAQAKSEHVPTPEAAKT